MHVILHNLIVTSLPAFDAFMKWLFGGSTFGTTLSNTAIFCCKQEVALFSSDKKLHILSSILLAAPKIGPTITFLSRTEPEKSMRHIRNMLDKCVLVAGVESSFGSEFTTACRELVPTKARFSDCTAIAADYCTTLKTRSDRQDVRNAAKAAIQLVDKTCFDLVRCYEFHELVTQRNVVDALIEVWSRCVLCGWIRTHALSHTHTHTSPTHAQSHVHTYPPIHARTQSHTQPHPPTYSRT